MAQFFNANRGKGQPAADAYKFHPYAKKPKPKAKVATPDDIKRLFGDL